MILPPEFSWVDTSDTAFSTVLDECLHGTDNLLVQSPAGAGKSLMIKIVASSIPNCIVLSPTGLTALNLCCDGVKAQTLHSFFLFPPVEVILEPGPFSSKTAKAVRLAKCIIIDEISMVSNHLLDTALDKIMMLRKDPPRLLLFGDLMQLPPVVPMSNEHVVKFYQSKYKGNVMFFNSEWFPKLDFKTMHLYKQFRQPDPVLAKRLVEIGYNEHSDETLDYFNDRVMPISQFEQDHDIYVRVAPTNAIVNKVNTEYTRGFQGQSQVYTAHSHEWRGQTPNDSVVELKIGMQVMCTMNSYDPDANYRNGTIGVVEKLDKDSAVIRKVDGKTTRVVMTPVNQYELIVDDANAFLKYRVRGSFCQIDCKPMRAMTCHRSQGKTLDAMYFQPAGFNSPGLTYVALSRIRTIDDLGISRKLTMKDILYNVEAFKFLEFGLDEDEPKVEHESLLLDD
jgi:ATP-dependent exoDNAse (exonuclease V) alpha subunit